jgi:hypothetical protein
MVSPTIFRMAEAQAASFDDTDYACYFGLMPVSLMILA